MAQSEQVKELEFLFFDAGGGHRAAANALREVIARRNGEWNVRLTNLQEMLDEIDVFRKVTGLRLQDLYNLLLKKGWTLGSPQLTRGMQLVIRLFHSQQVRLLERHWRTAPPDMVVSLIPNLNRAAGDAMRRAIPNVPLVTILTDIADYPPHFWIERQEQYFICGSDRAVAQAAAMGHRPERVFRASGMIVHPRFYEIECPTESRRRELRAALGFRPDEPVGLVLFGGAGSAVMEQIVRALPQRQLIAICGHNAKLHARLSRLERSAPLHLEEFTRDVPRFMQLADYLIGKPGPGSLSEAVVMRLPVIVERNAWTLPQERYNADWVREQGIGIVLPDFRRIAGAVADMLEPAAYTRFRAATEAIQNRAVFEIPGMLAEIFRRQSAGAR